MKIKFKIKKNKYNSEYNFNQEQLTKSESLGMGEFGFVDKYKITENSAKENSTKEKSAKELFDKWGFTSKDQYEIAVKKIKTADNAPVAAIEGIEKESAIAENEKKIGKILHKSYLKAKKKDPGYQLPYNLLRGGKIDGDPVGFSKLQTLKLSADQKPISGPPTEFAMMLANKQIKTEIAIDADIFLVQLMSSMYKSIQAIHDAKVIHLDVAARNFLLCNSSLDDNGNLISISAIATDYGNARKIRSEEKKLDASGMSLPIKWMDRECLDHSLVSINTDLYSLKITMHEVLNTYRRKSVNSPTKPFDEVPNKEYINNIQMEKTDNKILSAHIDLYKKSEANEKIDILLKSFEEFLTHTPASLRIEKRKNYPTSYTDRMIDRQLFTKSVDNFFLSTLKNKLKDYEENKEDDKLILSIKRLLSIEVSEQFKEDHFSLLKDLTEKKIKVEDVIGKILTEISKIDRQKYHLNEPEIEVKPVRKLTEYVDSIADVISSFNGEKQIVTENDVGDDNRNNLIGSFSSEKQIGPNPDRTYTGIPAENPVENKKSSTSLVYSVLGKFSNLSTRLNKSQKQNEIETNAKEKIERVTEVEQKNQIERKPSKQSEGLIQPKIETPTTLVQVEKLNEKDLRENLKTLKEIVKNKDFWSKYGKPDRKLDQNGNPIKHRPRGVAKAARWLEKAELESMHPHELKVLWDKIEKDFDNRLNSNNIFTDPLDAKVDPKANKKRHKYTRMLYKVVTDKSYHYTSEKPKLLKQSYRINEIKKEINSRSLSTNKENNQSEITKISPKNN